jgi:hypothetical protein
MLNIIYVKKIIESFMEYLYRDITTNPDEETTFLYRLLNGTTDGNYDFYQQAKKIYSRTPNNPNNIKVALEYPKDRLGLPCYVIREPGKNRGPVNNIGKINGIFPEDGNLSYLDSRQSNYEIMCFAVNMVESIMISEILYALLVSAHDILIERFDTIDYQMKELMVENELIPVPIFIRSIGLNVSCSEMIPGMVDTELLGKILFEKAEIAATLLTENEEISGLPGVESEII